MIAIVDYEAGNLTSVQRAVNYLGRDCLVTQDPEVVCSAERVIFPGVGAAGASMVHLQRLGLDQALHEVYRQGTPLLGICVGTQIILEFSEEDDGTECLGLLPGQVRRFPEHLEEDGRRLKVPHMGWNQIRLVRDHPVLKGLEPEHEFYFVHSYYPEPSDILTVCGWTDYGLTFAALVARDNLIAAQFHIEKSGRAGLRILDNFCKWDGKHA